MKLEEFSVTNFRSITKANKIKMSDYTVLLGKNNEGKSNFLLALKIALQSIRNYSIYQDMFFNRSILNNGLYNWDRDFPLQLQKRKKGLKSIFKCKFILSDKDIISFKNETKLNGNGTIIIRVIFGKDNKPNISILKQGTDLYKINSTTITNYISNHFNLNYIPTIRTEDEIKDNIYNAINSQFEKLRNTSEYNEAATIINQLELRVLKKLSLELKAPLKKFIPNLNEVRINLAINNRRNLIRYSGFSVEIDDGNLTSIDYKGDGIKSLITLAILSQKNSNSNTSIIAIEEPESHLHPEAIHNLVNIINNISENNQVIITTHSPLFVRRNNLDSNIIVDNGKAEPAKKIEKIREVLGVISADNLYNTENVLLVEGDDDRDSLYKILSLKSNIIKKSLTNNNFSILSMNGASNLSRYIIDLKNNLCSFIVLVDNDEAANIAIKKAKETGICDDVIIKQTICNGMKESEFEDCIKIDIYEKEFMQKYAVDIRRGCKNKKEKWSKRMLEIFENQGNKFDDTIKQESKRILSNIISNYKCDVDSILIKEKSGFIDSLVSAIEDLIIKKQVIK